MTVTVTFKLTALLKQLGATITALTRQSGNDTLIIIIENSAISLPNRTMKYDEGLIAEVAKRVQGYASIKVETLT